MNTNSFEKYLSIPIINDEDELYIINKIKYMIEQGHIPSFKVLEKFIESYHPHEFKIEILSLFKSFKKSDVESIDDLREIISEIN